MKREIDEIKISIELLHHLLRTAPYGVLRGMGNKHVSGCACESCHYVRKLRKVGAK